MDKYKNRQIDRQIKRYQENLHKIIKKAKPEKNSIILFKNHEKNIKY